MMIDGSFAIWNAVSNVMCGETRLMYYQRCWRIATGKAEPGDLNKTLFHNCYSHSMRAAKVMAKKFYYGKLYHAAMFWISLLFNCTSLHEMKEIVDSIYILTNCEMTSPLLERHFKLLKERQEQAFFACEFTGKDSNEDEKGTNDDVQDFYLKSVNEDTKQEQNSPFWEYFQQQYEEFLLSEEYGRHRFEANECDKRNMYYAPKFSFKLLKVVLSRICCTSRIMLGDLSRFSPADGPSTSKTCEQYLNFEKLYQRFSNSSLQSIATDNRTQGIIEQHFREVKHTMMKGERCLRLDVFVEVFLKGVETLQKSFFDCVLHQGPQVGKNNLHNINQLQKKCLERSSKKMRLPLSKFRKRKRRNKGFFSSRNVAKQLVYANEGKFNKSKALRKSLHKLPKKSDSLFMKTFGKNLCHVNSQRNVMEKQENLQTSVSKLLPTVNVQSPNNMPITDTISQHPVAALIDDKVDATTKLCASTACTGAEKVIDESGKVSADLLNTQFQKCTNTRSLSASLLPEQDLKSNFQQLKQSIDVSFHVHDVNGQIPVDASSQKKLEYAEHCFDARFEKTDVNFLPQPLLPSIAEPKHNECEKPVDFYLQQFDYCDSTQCLKTATSSVGDREANKDAIINLENHLVNLFDPENEIDNCFIGTIPHPFFIPHHFELLERYNRKIWENPPLKLCERALVTNNEEVITWADLLTIDASPADSIHARIQEHFKTNGGKGWLSTNVVNAYTFAAVSRAETRQCGPPPKNHLSGPPKIFFLGW